MSMARETKRGARIDERHARFPKQEARHFRSQERKWIHRYPCVERVEWKQWTTFQTDAPTCSKKLAGPRRWPASRESWLMRLATFFAKHARW